MAIKNQSSADDRLAIQAALAAEFQLPVPHLFGENLTLAGVVAASPRLVNSVDFMECCARVANELRKKTGVAIRLPATSLDTTVSSILDSFVEQICSQPKVTL